MTTKSIRPEHLESLDARLDELDDKITQAGPCYDLRTLAGLVSDYAHLVAIHGPADVWVENRMPDEEQQDASTRIADQFLQLGRIMEGMAIASIEAWNELDGVRISMRHALRESVTIAPGSPAA